MRSKVTVKTSVCWATTFSINGTYILKMKFIVSYQIYKIFPGDIKYSLKISFMDSVIQRVRSNHFSKKLLKYIFMKLDFINI